MKKWQPKNFTGQRAMWCDAAAALVEPFQREDQPQRLVFPDIWSFYRTCAKVPDVLTQTQRELGGSFFGTSPSNAEWTGSDSYEHALEQAHTGTPELVHGIERWSAQLEDVESYDMAQAYAYDVAGHYPDVGRYLEGEPECMITICEQPLAPSVSIAVDATLQFTADKSVSNAAGAALVSLVHTIERAGVRVRLDSYVGAAGCGPHGYKAHKVGPRLRRYELAAHDYETPHRVSDLTDFATSSLYMQIRLKDYGDPLDLDRIAFPCCHPSMGRRLSLSFFCMLDARWSCVHGLNAASCHGWVGMPKDIEADLCVSLNEWGMLADSPEQLEEAVNQQAKQALQVVGLVAT